MSVLQKSLALTLALALLAGLAGLTRVPWSVETTERSVLRLSWRALGERIERCRPATTEELASAPAHMRQEVICEDPRVAPYKLRIAVDGRVLEDKLADGSDMSGDRPIYVLREFDLAPGSHQVDVRFEKQVVAATDADLDDKRESEREHDREVRRRAVPAVLRLDTTVTVPANAVLLVTYSPGLRQLVLVSSQTPVNR